MIKLSHNGTTLFPVPVSHIHSVWFLVQLKREENLVRTHSSSILRSSIDLAVVGAFPLVTTDGFRSSPGPYLPLSPFVVML